MTARRREGLLPEVYVSLWPSREQAGNDDDPHDDPHDGDNEEDDRPRPPPRRPRPPRKIDNELPEVWESLDREDRHTA